MKIYLAVAVTATILWTSGLLAGCVVASHSLSPANVEAAIQTLDEPTAKRIAKLEESINGVNEAISMYAFMGIIELDDAKRARRQLIVAHYYMSYAWVKLVEDELTRADSGATFGEAKVALAVEILKASAKSKPQPKESVL